MYNTLEDDQITLNEQLTTYRVTQECVNNILKYSSASYAEIQLVEHEGIVSLLIDDDGLGFDLNKELARNKGMGLKNIINRGSSLDAEVEIDSKIGRGTTISLHFQPEMSSNKEDKIATPLGILPSSKISNSLRCLTYIDIAFF